ncbi:MAG: hypothetical protein KatS3mg105_1961 [Gemmatales bacterium]|nr:MAG: hypothetical protein KatS3mg105_1961 [Gemmatales bacterium]
MKANPACLCVLFVAATLTAEEPKRADDPKIIELLKNMRDNEGRRLPKVNVEGVGAPKRGPYHRDYCNKMVYAPDRETALYMGGSHQTWRGNDVWEYHLGSNTWNQLFAPDGGNHAHLKYTLYFGALKSIRRDPKGKVDESTLSRKDREELEKTRDWWKKNVINQKGNITTRKGGPIMNAHTWDGITYDPLVKRVLWASGAGPASLPQYHAYLMGIPFDKLEVDPTYTRMWMFEPAKRAWIHYRHTGPMPQLRGMGASMCYIDDLKKSIYYVAATNVSPPAFEMWTFDAVADKWQELKPNGGKAISVLASKEKVAPIAEQQMAYSPQHKKLVAVLKHDTFVYDVVRNRWAKVNTDTRIDAHDARTIFAYDCINDVFLLANPRTKNGPKLAAFSLKTNSWEPLKWQGDSIPGGLYVNYMGYFDPLHNVFVLDGGNNIWVYRYRRN